VLDDVRGDDIGHREEMNWRVVGDPVSRCAVDSVVFRGGMMWSRIGMCREYRARFGGIDTAVRTRPVHSAGPAALMWWPAQLRNRSCANAAVDLLRMSATTARYPVYPGMRERV
jgi:hypothetical protein